MMKEAHSKHLGISKLTDSNPTFEVLVSGNLNECCGLLLLVYCSEIATAIGGAKNTKVRKLMGALWIPVSLVLGYSEQFSELL